MTTSKTSTTSFENRVIILAQFARHLPSPEKRDKKNRAMLGAGSGIHMAYNLDEYKDYFSSVTDKMKEDIDIAFDYLLGEYSYGEDEGFESWEELSSYVTYGVYAP